MRDPKRAVRGDGSTRHRSPFLTQSVAVIGSRRSLRRVTIGSPAPTVVSSCKRTARPGIAGEAVGLPARSARGRHAGWRRAAASRDRPLRRASFDRISDDGGVVAGVHAIVVEIEAKSDGLADAQRQRSYALGRVVEPDERLEGRGADASAMSRSTPPLMFDSCRVSPISRTLAPAEGRTR